MFDLTKPYQCRNGNSAVVTEIFDGSYWGRVKSNCGGWMQAEWFCDGATVRNYNSGYDLINIPEIVEVHRWMNFYPEPHTNVFRYMYSSESEAKVPADMGAEGTIHLIFRVNKTDKTCEVIQMKE